jgi:hypothetical protein
MMTKSSDIVISLPVIGLHDMADFICLTTECTPEKTNHSVFLNSSVLTQIYRRITSPKLMLLRITVDIFTFTVFCKLENMAAIQAGLNDNKFAEVIAKAPPLIGSYLDCCMDGLDRRCTQLVGDEQQKPIFVAAGQDESVSLLDIDGRMVALISEIQTLLQTKVRSIGLLEPRKSTGPGATTQPAITIAPRRKLEPSPKTDWKNFFKQSSPKYCSGSSESTTSEDLPQITPIILTETLETSEHSMLPLHSKQLECQR